MGKVGEERLGKGCREGEFRRKGWGKRQSGWRWREEDILKDGERNWEGGRKGCESWEAGLERTGRQGWCTLEEWTEKSGESMGLQKEGSRKGTQENGIVARL